MMNIDLKCPACGHIVIDHFKRTSDEPLPYCRQRTTDPAVLCGTLYERVHLPTRRGTVIGDECDVWVEHGICNEDGSPRRYDSKAAMRKEAEKRGLTNYVVHDPGKTGEASNRVTSRWV